MSYVEWFVPASTQYIDFLTIQADGICISTIQQ